jgi:glycosyltransferase involved in cell wall biosynthesis
LLNNTVQDFNVRDVFMKKILHLIAQKPDYTGSGIYLQGIIKEATKKLYPQALVTGISRDDDMDEFQFPDTLAIYPVYFDTKELPFPVVGMSDTMPYPSTKYKELAPAMYLLWRQAFIRAIKNALDNFKPDLIISHHLWLLSALAKNLAPEIPMICISHATDLRQLELAPQFTDGVIAGCSKIERIIALNNFQAEKIAGIYKIPKESITVGGVGFNPAVFYPPTHREKNKVKKIIYAGKLSRAKGVISLFRACELLYSEEPNFELFLFGSGDGKEAKKLAAMAKNISFKLTAPGTVSQPELGNVFRQGDVFVLPSFYEGLPLVVIEALASGLRVVVSDLPGLKPWLGDEINHSGLVSYVPLPGMVRADQPITGELPTFESQLKNSLLAQINRPPAARSAISPKIKQAIAKLSWFGVFEKIEKFFSIYKTRGQQIAQ